jgi:hypothetical protein
MRRRVIVGALALGVLAAPASVHAQGGGVRDKIQALFTFGECDHLFYLTGVAAPRGDDFDHASDTDGKALSEKHVAGHP